MRPTQTLVDVSSITVQKTSVRTLFRNWPLPNRRETTDSLSAGVVALLDSFERAVPTS
jgi:hypothetical protein